MAKVSTILLRTGLGVLASGALLVVNVIANRFISANGDSLANDITESLEQARERHQERQEEKRYVA